MDGASVFHDTIFALSSGGLPSGVAIIRISGKATRHVVQSIAGHLPFPRHARLCRLTDADGGLIDTALVLFFPAPASFTGEDCAELHLHGGRSVVAAMFRIIGSLPGTRQAEAGEFAKRAFINGKMDLTAAEALADLIASETEAQRRFAVENGGRQRELYDGWRRRLVRMQAQVEAVLDFSDQEDVTDGPLAAMHADATELMEAMRAHVCSFDRAEMIRNGFRVVILGAPNAGKSSLLNALARRDVAIVTEEAGTTRDVLDVALDIDGMKVMLSDTAGLRDDPGRVEGMGIARAMERAGGADLVLFLDDLSAETCVSPPCGLSVLRIGTKADLVDQSSYPHELKVSANTGEGLDALLSVIGGRARAMEGNTADVLPFRERHVELVRAAIGHLGATGEIDEGQLELAAEELRLAATALGRITGAIDPEEVLGAIFAEFCIGK